MERLQENQINLSLGIKTCLKVNKHGLLVAYSHNSKFKVKSCKFQYKTLLGEFRCCIKHLDMSRNEKNRFVLQYVQFCIILGVFSHNIYHEISLPNKLFSLT